MSNSDILARVLVQKGVLTDADLSGGATLNAAQREDLADLTIAAFGLAEHATVEKIYDTWDYDSIELTGRYAELDNGTESAGRKPSSYKLTLDPVPLKTVLTLQDSFLRKLATKPIPEEQKAKILAEAQGIAMANDIDRMILYSNTLGPSIKEADFLNNGSGHATNRVKDTTFSEFNGLIAAADASGSAILTHDAASSSDLGLVLREMYKNLPPAYRTGKANKQDLRYYMPSDLYENLKSQLQKRQTHYGDWVLTKGQGESEEAIFFNGILCVELPLFDINPYVVEHITMNGTTAKNLKYKPISASTFYANAAALGSTATAPYVDTTDYVLNTTNGTVAVAASGSAIGNTDSVKYMYQTLPQIFLTKKSNFIIGVSVNDMLMETERHANKGATDFVTRTRYSYGFVKAGWVSRAINVADTVIASY